MADTFKVLGQILTGDNIVGGTPVDLAGGILYTVPSGSEATVSSIIVCHAGTGNHAYYIAIRPNGSTKSLKNYIVYGKSLSSGENAVIVAGIALNDGDIIEVQTTGTDVVFSAFGVETK
jgi:hypothetical protein|tara:strand:- start:569 stop:925 length:357 start_codon:yes stop_codon:yes gene_type:complete